VIEYPQSISLFRKLRYMSYIWMFFSAAPETKWSRKKTWLTFLLLLCQILITYNQHCSNHFETTVHKFFCKSEAYCRRKTQDRRQHRRLRSVICDDLMVDTSVTNLGHSSISPLAWLLQKGRISCHSTFVTHHCLMHLAWPLTIFLQFLTRILCHVV